MKHHSHPIGPRAIVLFALVGLLAATAGAQTAARDEGLLIIRVLPDSPAEKAGILRGDIALAVDGKTLQDPASLREALSDKKAGQKVELSLLRGGNALTKAVSLEERLYRPALGLLVLPGGALADSLSGPDGAAPGGDVPGKAPRLWLGNPAAPQRTLPRLGEGQELQRLRKLQVQPFGAPIALVDEVVEGSPAQKAGIVPGDRIRAIDGKDLPAGGIVKAIEGRKPGDSLVLTLIGKDSGERELRLVLGDSPEKKGQPYVGIRYSLVPPLAAPFLDPGRSGQKDAQKGAKKDTPKDAPKDAQKDAVPDAQSGATTAEPST